MRKEDLFITDSFGLIPPDKPGWTVNVTSNFKIYIVNPPNRFHRFMQRLAFGFIWTKL